MARSLKKRTIRSFTNLEKKLAKANVETNKEDCNQNMVYDLL